MKRIVFVLTALIILASCSNTSMGSGKNSKIVTLEDSLSYGIGLSMGDYLNKIEKEIGTDINGTIVLRAINEVLEGKETEIPLENLDMIMSSIQQKIVAKAGELAKTEGEAFLAENAKKEGVVTTESGLQYKILKEGNGPIPVEGSTVSVHYILSSIDGTVLQNSYDNSEPVKFTTNGVIKGWTEALLMMPVGSKWKLFIPSELAYGERPPQRSGIKPNSALVFEVELLSIEPDAKK